MNPTPILSGDRRKSRGSDGSNRSRGGGEGVDEKKSNNGDKNDKRAQIPLHGNQDTRPGNFWNVFCFGICMISPNICISWSYGFAHGYWDFFVTLCFVSVAFINLMLCVAEMVSILPFSGNFRLFFPSFFFFLLMYVKLGGMYGFARVTVGPYLGFLVGCCEAMANIIYTAVGTIPVGTTITYIFNSDPKNEPMYWVFAYLSIILSEYLGRKIYFNFLNTYAFVLVMILVFYLIISFQSIDTEQYISRPQGQVFTKGIGDFFSIVPTVGWFFFGMETIPLISDEIRNAKRDTPRGIIATLIFVVVCSFIVPFVVYTQYPGLQDDQLADYFPLNGGFIAALGITDRSASIFALPSLYIANALYIFGYGKQLSALAQSRLLPTFLSWTLPNSKIPYSALIVGSGLGIVLLFLLTYPLNQNYNSIETSIWFNAALLGSYFTFIITFSSFIIFRAKYANLKRLFVNPLGIPGAVIGIMAFLFMSVGLIGFSADDYKAIQYFVCFMVICTIYYYLYARYRQRFSKEEQDVMFIVYLIKSNEKKNRLLRTGLVTRNSINQNSTSLSFPTNHQRFARDLIRSPHSSQASPGSSRNNSMSIQRQYPSELVAPSSPPTTTTMMLSPERRKNEKGHRRLFTFESIPRVVPDDSHDSVDSDELPNSARSDA